MMPPRILASGQNPAGQLVHTFLVDKTREKTCFWRIFLCKVWSLEFFMTLQWIILKVRIFTKSGLINRAVRMKEKVLHR